MRKRFVAAPLLMVTAVACGGAVVGGRDAGGPARVGAAGLGACRFSSPAVVPLGRTGAGATLALAKIAGRRVALVADEDDKSVLTVDLDSREALARTPLGATPAEVYVTSDGRVFATLRDKNELVLLEATAATSPLTQRCTVETPSEPIGIGASPDDATVVVTAGWGEAVVAFDGRTLAKKVEAKVPREPRRVVVSDDGKTAFVSHAVGSLVSAVDLTSKHEVRSVPLRGHDATEERSLAQQLASLETMMKGETATKNPNVAQQIKDQVARLQRRQQGRISCQGFALAKSSAAPGRIFAPQVLVDPGDPEGRPDGYGDDNTQTETPSIAVVDEGTGEALASSLTLGRELSFVRRNARGDARDPNPECLLPRAAAIDPQTKSLLVTCFGIDAVVAYDAASANPLTSERRRWTVGSGPSGIAVDAEKRRGVVWSQFDRTLSTFPLGGAELVDDKVVPAVVQRTAMPPLERKMAPEYALGRILFHAAGDVRIAGDGRACASCHPDGRDDAITWATPLGPRRSIMLAGRVAKTGPYSWEGNETTLPNHLANTFDRLSGKGLHSVELDALVAYITEMPAPGALVRERGEGALVASDKSAAERGRAIFTSKEAGCSGCHAGATLTDGRNHDVGSRAKSDKDAAFNTPSLHLVGGTGPYFHDGRYATLKELIDKNDGMGSTKQLSPGDRDALEAFLRTL